MESVKQTVPTDYRPVYSVPDDLSDTDADTPSDGRYYYYCGITSLQPTRYPIALSYILLMVAL